MTFFLGLVAYVVHLVHRPLDRRLKQRHVGPLAVVAGAGVLVWLWSTLAPAALDTTYLLADLAGVESVYLMAWVMVLAARARVLEPWFGGLDQMYRLHRHAAWVSVALLLPHQLATGRGPALPPAEIARRTDLGVVLGGASLLLLVALVLLSLPSVGRILRLRYHRWLFVHRLIGVFLLLGILHGVLLDQVIAGSTVLFWVYLLVAGTGMLAYLYAELVMRRRAPRSGYTVVEVDHPGGDVLDLVLAADGAPSAMRAGQFVFLTFADGDWHEHPFSLAGLRDDGSIRLVIRTTGHETSRMARELHPGAPATVVGPYGRFDRTVGGPRQVWVAGGTGVAPFLAWLSTATPEDIGRVELFYSTSTREDAVHLGELRAEEARLPGLTVHAVVSTEKGRLTSEALRPYLGGGDHPTTHVFLCGPASLVSGLRRGLLSEGLTRDHVHSEHFAFR